ncbi:MAG: hypothetical protein QW569_04810 [Candidatus Bathyarchaeia archaeon]
MDYEVESLTVIIPVGGWARRLMPLTADFQGLREACEHAYS